MDREAEKTKRKARMAAVFIGIGLGGFADGIILQQILQWHQMISTILPPEGLGSMKINMRWDGYFFAGVWLFTLIGVYMLWNAARRPHPLPGNSYFTGSLFIGWGLFNLVEGIINHHILEIHHVRGYAPNPGWDYGFLIIGGIGFLLIGMWLYHRDASRPQTKGI
jgi:uncharacterized membrane protein